jgi:hypothetical protein
MRHSFSGGDPGTGAPPPHSLYYADANEPEMAANAELLRRIEASFTVKSTLALDTAITMFVDIIIEAKKLERRAERGPICQFHNVHLSIRDLLLHLPLQRWPVPHPNRCPCVFCEEIGDWRGLEEHLQERHRIIFEEGAFHSEVQLQLLGLLGLGMRVNKRKRWTCPFGYCTEELLEEQIVCRRQ